MRSPDNTMLGQNITFFAPAQKKTKDWNSQELAEFYRVESALIQGGMRVVTDRGVSDEGDPWFVFCREQDGEPVVHFARIDGQYVIASPAYDGASRGLDFRSMVQELIARHKLVPSNSDKKSNVYIHPSALLIILVGTAYFKTPSQAKADELGKAPAFAQKEDGSSAVWGSRVTAPTSDAAWSWSN